MIESIRWSRIFISGNAHNRLGLLSHNKFVEGRVKDDDEDFKEGPPPAYDEVVKTEDEASLRRNAIQSSLDFIDRAFHKVEVGPMR